MAISPSTPAKRVARGVQDRDLGSGATPTDRLAHAERRAGG
jgi:hypothetical protein